MAIHPPPSVPLIRIAALAWLAGVALQLQQDALWSRGFYLVAALAALGVVVTALVLITSTSSTATSAHSALAARVWRSRPWLCASVMASAIAVLAFGITAYRAHQRLDERLDAPSLVALEGRDLDVVAVVSDMPQRLSGSIRLRIEVEQAVLDGRVLQAFPRDVLISWYGRDLSDVSLRAGERWQMRVRLRAPHGVRNPHGFDAELWMFELGVDATGYVRTSSKDPPPMRLGVLSAGQAPLLALQRVRQAVRDRLMALGRSTEGSSQHAGAAAVVASLVTGDQRVIERGDWDVFRATGIAHLLSISGLHITLFAWISVLLVGWLWRQVSAFNRERQLWSAPVVALWSGVALAAAYALFAGWAVPAQRTVWMLLAFVICRSAGVRLPWWVAWLAAACLVSAVDPWALLQPGFWLSFVAVGVLFTADLSVPRAGSWAQRALAAAREGVRTQVLLSVVLAPLSLLLFHQASLVGLVANLLAVPWVTLVVTPLGLMGAAWQQLFGGDAMAWLAIEAMHLLQAVLVPLAALPWATWSAATAPVAVGLLALAGAALAMLRLPWAWRVLGVSWIAPLVLWQPAAPAPGAFELMAFDVGQGSAVLVRTAKHHLLYDTGPQYSAESDAGHRVIVPALRALGVRLDAVVLSHQDSDHAGGAAAVAAAQPQAQWFSSLPPTHALRAATPHAPCTAPHAWVWDGVRFEFVHPSAEVLARAHREPATKPNSISCVLRVVASNGEAALLTGDIEAEQERALLASGQMIRARLLLAPHHGSKTSSTIEFLRAVGAQQVIVQAGYRNRFGHPASEVVERYQAERMQITGSPKCGAAVWRSDEPGAIQCERKQRRRYWQHRLD